MPKIPLYNQGQGGTVQTAVGALSPRANVGAFTAPGQAQAAFAEKAREVAFQFGMQEKKRETDRIYGEEFLRLQDEGTTFNLENKDTNMEDYQKNWTGFQTGIENRINSMNLTRSQKASIIQRLAPDFAKQNIAGKQNAYNRGRNIASSTFQSVTNNDIETMSNLPFMHPDRVAIRKRISDSTAEALQNDLDIGKYTPSFVDNQVEVLSATKALNAAQTLADIDGVDNLIKSSSNLTAVDIKTLNTDKETARNRVRQSMIGTLASSLSLEDVGVDVRSIEQIDQRQNDLLSGKAFAQNPDLKKLYDSLDSVGKKQYVEAVNQRARDMRTQLTFSQTQSDRRIKQNNEEIYQDFSGRILTFGVDTPSVSEITSADFQGKDGETMRQAMLGLLERRMSADLLTQSSPATYINTKTAIHTNAITSLTQPFTLQHEKGQEGFASTVSFEQGKSLIDRAGAPNGLSFDDYSEFANLILDRDKANSSAEASRKKVAEDALQRFFTANKERIMGYSGLKKLDLSSEARFYDFEIYMGKRFREAIEAGKDYQDLLDPRHPDYLLKQPDKFALSFKEQIKLVGQQMQSDQPELSEIAPPKKLPNETYTQYLERADDYYKSEDYRLYQSLLPQETK